MWTVGYTFHVGTRFLATKHRCSRRLRNADDARAGPASRSPPRRCLVIEGDDKTRLGRGLIGNPAQAPR